MVILQFNKLIRNKWVWGVFALVVSAVFVCPDNLFSNRSDAKTTTSFGKLAGKEVDANIFNAQVAIARANERNMAARGARIPESSYLERNHNAWRDYATAETAEANGIVVSDEQLADAIVNSPMFRGPNGFDANVYAMIVQQEFGLTVKEFEASVRRELEARAQSGLFSAAVWASPMEVAQATYDKTDKFTVQVANFVQTKEEAAAIKMDDEGLKKWYDANSKILALPELVKIRYVAVDASDTNLLAKMVVTEDDLRDIYDSDLSKYTSVGTNGEEVVKSFDEVKSGIESELRQALAVDCIKTNLQERAFDGLTDGQKGEARVDRIAKERGLKTAESDWFSAGDDFFMPAVPGFATYPGLVLPGIGNDDLVTAVRALDPESEFDRYTILSSSKAVYLLERAAVAPAHTPSFEEAKAKIADRALADAKADAFKAKVAALIAKGSEALVAAAVDTTNVTFTATTEAGAFPNQAAVVSVASKLKKGEISELSTTGTGKGFVVICQDRVADASSLAVLTAGQELASGITMPALQQLFTAWPEWNLARLGYVTSKASEDVDPATVSAEDDEKSAN